MAENPFIGGDIDSVLETLDDKVIRTDEGSFIRVDDLREYERQVREMKQEEAQKVKPKTFREARALAMADPELQTPALPPRAPALSSVKGVTDREA
jgi:hypothetical protein